MGLYVISPTTGACKASYERSPVVSLVSDAREDSVPSSIRAICATQHGGEAIGRGALGDPPEGTDGVVVWLAGETLAEGSPAGVRADLMRAGRRCLVPVHVPCLPGLDLVALQPRWAARGERRDYLRLEMRIGSTAPAMRSWRAAVTADDPPWGPLTNLVLDELAEPGSGLEPLAGMAFDASLIPPVNALAIRNLAILLARRERLDAGLKFLRQGVEAFPDCAELYYVAAVLALREERPDRAAPLLEKAVAAGERGYVGSGGENGYRAQHLLAGLALEAGNQLLGWRLLLPGLVRQPAYEPSVRAAIGQRMPSDAVQRAQWDLTGIARREPGYRDAIIDFLLDHRCFGAARRAACSAAEHDGERARHLERIDAACASRAVSSATAPPGIRLCGPVHVHSSLARINRELGAEIERWAGATLSIDPFAPAKVPAAELSKGAALAPALQRRLERLDLTIRHHWPPDFRRPESGRLACIVPWEFGAVPRRWVPRIEAGVDELWVPSEFVRGVFTRAGVAGDKVVAIPNGIDTDVFRPEGIVRRPGSTRRCMLLFAGGTIRRKGIDLLLEAYRAAFDPGEDVTLVIADLGSHGLYGHMALTGRIQAFARDARNPHVVLLSRKLDDATLASLYRTADAFVLPFRGEGFGMPLVEAMACGTPVITTGRGPAPEFCDADVSDLLPADECEVPEGPPVPGEQSGPVTWFEPDKGALVDALRRVYERPDEAAARGREAARRVAARFDWGRIVPVYRGRIEGLLADPARVESTAAGAALAGGA